MCFLLPFILRSRSNMQNKDEKKIGKNVPNNCAHFYGLFFSSIKSKKKKSRIISTDQVQFAFSKFNPIKKEMERDKLNSANKTKQKMRKIYFRLFHDVYRNCNLSRYNYVLLLLLFGAHEMRPL